MAGKTASLAVESAIGEGLLGPSNSIELQTGQPQPLGLFYDLDVFERGLQDVQNAFGAGTLVFYKPTDLSDFYRNLGTGA